MIRKLFTFAAVSLIAVSIGCSSGPGPIAPDKDIETNPEEVYFVIDPSEGVIGSFTYTDVEGNMISSGTLGRDEDGSLYIIEGRGAQFSINLTPLGLVDANVTYLNPVGTAGNGIPYWYRGQTMEYEINVRNLTYVPIGWSSNPAEVRTEMRRAYINMNTGVIIVGELMLGEPVFTWYGILYPGITVIPDDFYIHPSNPSGNFVTTCRISAPFLCGIFDIIFFDGVAGMFDPY